MTPQQIATGYFALCAFAVLALFLAVDRYINREKIRRPRVIVAVSSIIVSPGERANLQAKLAADDHERDYTFVEAHTQTPVIAVEIG